MPTKKVLKKSPVKKITKSKKKPVAKALVQKKTAPKKKTVAKKSSKNGKVLVCANEKSCFWTNDGQILKDLLSLRDALDTMHEDVFAHHVTKEKNDFADWVEYVLQDAECAGALRKSKKPNTARTVVVKHLRFYTT